MKGLKLFMVICNEHFDCNNSTKKLDKNKTPIILEEYGVIDYCINKKPIEFIEYLHILP